jgi:RNA recognition motif-containing protein
LLVKHSRLPREHAPPPKNKNLYIKPLENMTEKGLYDLFGRFGPIENVKIMLDPQTSTSLQVGFVRFFEQEHADIAMVQLTNTTPFPGCHPIVVKYAETPEMRESRRRMKNHRTQHIPNVHLENNAELLSVLRINKTEPRVCFGLLFILVLVY